jgi:hypothetical protein
MAADWHDRPVDDATASAPTDARTLYLDLLKKVLTRHITGEPYRPPGGFDAAAREDPTR